MLTPSSLWQEYRGQCYPRKYVLQKRGSEICYTHLAHLALKGFNLNMIPIVYKKAKYGVPPQVNPGAHTSSMFTPIFDALKFVDKTFYCATGDKLCERVAVK